jgi:hypothetical protein
MASSCQGQCGWLCLGCHHSCCFSIICPFLHSSLSSYDLGGWHHVDQFLGSSLLCHPWLENAAAPGSVGLRHPSHYCRLHNQGYKFGQIQVLQTPALPPAALVGEKAGSWVLAVVGQLTKEALSPPPQGQKVMANCGKSLHGQDYHRADRRESSSSAKDDSP